MIENAIHFLKCIIISETFCRTRQKRSSPRWSLIKTEKSRKKKRKAAKDKERGNEERRGLIQKAKECRFKGSRSPSTEHQCLFIVQSRPLFAQSIRSVKVQTINKFGVMSGLL